MRWKSTQEPLWIYPSNDPAWIKTIASEFNLHPIAAEVLAARSFTNLSTIHDYLYAKLPDLHDPHLFYSMDKAVERILTAIELSQGILIYGDNDVDGITATALLTEFLEFIKAKVFYYIPSRTSLKQEGMTDAIPVAKNHGCSLIITVDCGITAAVEIAAFTERGFHVIVTDHHEPTSTLPNCTAILNPKLASNTYPDRGLTGVGVAFKLAHGITNALINQGKIIAGHIDLKRYLDLVALGTIADMGSLLGENRILVRYGLRQLRKTRRIGLVKLCSICNLKMTEISTMDISSKIAPRLNSLGRIADPTRGVELLLLRDPIKAQALALELDVNNYERQKIEHKDTEEINSYLASHPSLLHNKALILDSENWHPGVIPIITAKISKLYSRPTIVIAIEGHLGKGSIRTIPEFPLLTILKNHAHLLETFGGHDFAAGLLIKEDNIPLFRKSFIQIANQILSDRDIIPKLRLDAAICFRDITLDFMESLHLLEPFGHDNPPPIFYCKVKQIWPSRVVGKNHLKLYITYSTMTPQDKILEAIGFGMAERKEELKTKGPLYIAFTPRMNHFLNKSNIQLHLRDFKSLSTGLNK